MFDTTKPIYSRPDGSFVITYMGNPYHLSKEDPNFSEELWGAVMEFIKENPAAVKPEPEPEPPDLPPEAFLPNPLEERIEALEKQVQELCEQVSEIARR